MLWLLTAALAQTLVSPDYPAHCQSPQWSPDGAMLSWEVNWLERKSIELYVAPFTGSLGAPRKIQPVSRASSATAGFSTSTSAVHHELSFAPPAFSPFFIYASSGAGQDYDLYLSSGGALSPAPGTDGNPAWSPDGKRIVFSSARTGQGDLYLLAPDGTGALLRLTGDETASELYPAWSPDGKKIAYVGHTSEGDNLWIIDDLAFPAPRAVTKWPHTQTRPAWSPDNRWIAFYSNHTKIDRYDLYVLSVSGGEPVLMDTDVLLNPRGPVWSPDGAHVIYVKADEAKLSPIYASPVSNPAGRKLVNVGTVGNQDIAVVGRADGVWLAVAALGRVGDAVRDFRRVYLGKVVL